MENEKFKVIRIDTGKAVTSVKELRKYIQDLRDKLLEVNTDEQQLKQTTDALSQAQSTLADVTGRSAKEMSASETSIVGMRKEYKKLYDQYKLFSDEQRNSPLGKEMGKTLESLSTKINNANKGVGNFKDNIGRYTQSISQALGGVSQGFGGMGTAIKGAAGMFKALNAAMGPVGIIIGALVLAFKALSNGIKGSSDTSARFGQTMAKLKGFIVPVQKAIEKLASVFVDNLSKALDFVNQKLQEFADKLNIKWLQNYLKEAEEAGKQTEEIERRRQQNQSYYNHMLKANKDDEVKIAQLRADAEDKTKHSIEERQAMLKEADRREQNIYKRKLAYAREEYEIQLAVNNLTENVSSENERLLAEKYENLRQAELDYQNKRRGLIRQNNRLDSESEKQQKEANDQLKQYYETLLKAAAAEKDFAKYKKLSLEYLSFQLKLQKEAAASAFTGDMLTEMNKAIDASGTEERLNAILKFYKDTYEVQLKEAELEKDSQERRRKEKAALDDYYIKIKQLYDYFNTNATKPTKIPQDIIDFIKGGIDFELSPQQKNELGIEVGKTIKEVTDKAFEEVKVNNEKRNVDLLSSIYLNSNGLPIKIETELETQLSNAFDIMKFWQQKYDDFKKGKSIGYTKEEVTKNYAEAQKAFLESEEKLYEAITKKRTTEMQNVSALWGESEIRTLKQNVEIARYELERVQRNVGESEEDFYARRLAAQKKFNDASAALDAQYLTNLTETMTAISSLIGSGGDAWEEYINLRVNSGKLTNAAAEKEFENLKKYRYSETVLNTLAGAIAAYTSAQSLGLPMGPIVGGINAAAVTAAGAAQLMKIKQTHFGEGSVDSTIKAGQTRYNDGYIEYANGRSTGTSELSELNKTVQALSKQVKDVKVIVTEGDVTRMQNIVQAKVAEASW